jgi:hypothetical protein
VKLRQKVSSKPVKFEQTLKRISCCTKRRQDKIETEEEYKILRNLSYEQAENTTFHGWRSTKDKDATHIVQQKGRKEL